MELRRLGASPLQVSALCLGTMMFGNRTEAAEAERIVEDARAAGVNFIDTADMYADGNSERIVGRLIARDRDDWVLATKGVNPPVRPGPNRGGPSRKWLTRALDASLLRLGTDYVDIYYLHKDDERLALDETVAFFGDAIAAGKCLYWGLSNIRAWRIAEVVRLCDLMNVPRPVVCQPYYNALNRMPEVEILPACRNYGVGVVPFSPLARGVLSAKYEPGAEPPPDTRAGRRDPRMMQTEWRAESLAVARDLRDHAEARGTTAVAFALAWVLASGNVHSVIAGPRTLGQWRDYLDGLAFLERWGEEDDAIVNSLVPPGHPSTPGYTDPKMPVRGR